MMIAVDDIERAPEVWTDALNMHPAESAPGWAMLEHLTTHQRITLSEGDLGTHRYVAVRAENLEAAITDLPSHGAAMSDTVESPVRRASLCLSPFGAPILLYTESDDVV